MADAEQKDLNSLLIAESSLHGLGTLLNFCRSGQATEGQSPPQDIKPALATPSMDVADLGSLLSLLDAGWTVGLVAGCERAKHPLCHRLLPDTHDTETLLGALSISILCNEPLTDGRKVARRSLASVAV